MTSSDIIEMQVRPANSGLLSFISREEGTCDPDTPENVHKEFILDSGDSREIPLSTSTSNIDRGEEYDIWIVTRQECGGDRAEPYGSGVIADTVFVEDIDSDGDGIKDSNDVCPETPGSKDDGCPVEPEIRLGSQDIELSVTESNVKTDFAFTNVAEGSDGLLNPDEGDMEKTHIVEMQVVPAGTGLLSVTSSSRQKTCDADYPQNVHKEYQIAQGETLDITLQTSLDNLDEGEKYDVWIVTRQECGGGPAGAYPTGDKVGSFTYSAEEPTEICGNGKDDDGDGEVDENCGNDLPVIPIIGAFGLSLVVIGGVYRLA